MKRAIVVVDVQVDFVEGGSLAIAGGQAVADNLCAVLPFLAGLGIDVFYTKDWHIDPGSHFSDEPDFADSWPVHCKAGTRGADFAADFTPQENRVFLKGQYAAAYSGAEGVNSSEESLLSVLQEGDYAEIVVVGLAFDYCVAATALDLAAAGLPTYVAKNATASVHPETDSTVIGLLERRGVKVIEP